MMDIPDPTPAEAEAMRRDGPYLDAFGEFSDKLVTGQNPSLETHLKKYPEFADRLRGELESAIWFHSEFQQMKREHPAVDWADVLLYDVDDDLRQRIKDLRRHR
jgi:hypothetical protein